MKILQLLLGYYSNRTPFYLYQIPDSTILLFKLKDITTLFNVADLACHPSLNQVPHGECYTSNSQQQEEDNTNNTTQHYYISAQVLARTAVALNRYRLAELCKLKPNDYAAGLADSILKNIPSFERTQNETFQLMDMPMSPVISPVPSPLQQRSIQHSTTSLTTTTTITSSSSTNTNSTTNGIQQNLTLSPQVNPVKSEPLSPPPLRLSQPKENKDDQRPVNPMALGKVLCSQHSYPNVMNNLSNGQGQTLLAKRQGKNSRHLTIFAPSYADPLSVSIRSAPLNSNFPQAPLLSPRAAPVLSTHQHHQHHHHHHQEPKTTGGTFGKQEFAIPPIVPSQQQPPHTAHPHHSTGNGNHGYASSPSLFGRPTSSSHHAYSKSSPAAAPMPPQTPTTYSFAALQRQQFLQPFEHLFDTIETTRTLKSTLDDQIRRSSTLLQTLQASSTTVEGLIRSQIREMQKEMTGRLDEILESMMKRIGQLESKLDVTATTESSITNGMTTAPLRSPTTIVRSQNDIGPSEYQSMLNTLLERIDRLESQLDK
ncbi:uncharacterized protein BX664DRAFT_278381 [Halteromyces radiatus]|uniref:uncharacterized protein n=1 Tax=Halteromyces radiatus TaxID=101107 RepID=UPI00221E8711|nr:uncharacterized protein BX664DRAFT_278381 [Halteromyces radiatus]KAI8093420.1 hypothetical protein BX664DRAFT_278381 [Halteromyces radiatus]